MRLSPCCGMIVCQGSDSHSRIGETRRQRPNARILSDDTLDARWLSAHSLFRLGFAYANATLEQMKVVEEMRRTLREIKDVNTPTSN